MKNTVIALVMLFLGCNTLPVGYDQLQRIPADSSLTLGPDTLASYAKYIPLGAADIMSLGQDSAYESRIIINFTLADSSLDSVKSAKLILHPADSTPMSFVCRPCSVAWNSNAVSWKMADSVTHWLNPGGDYWHIDLGSGTFEGESLVIDLNLDYLDTLVRNSHGIILFPSDTGFVAVHSRYSQTTAPRICLTYPDDVKKICNAVEDAHLVDTNNIHLNPQYLEVGSGVAFRTYLRFPLDSVPEEATIARAEISFLPHVEYRRNDTLSLGVHRLFEPFSRYARFEDEPCAHLNYIISPDADSVATLDIRKLVQFWTANPPDSNFGLLLTAYPEWSEMFRIKIPRAGPNALKLKLLYIMPPEDRIQ